MSVGCGDEEQDVEHCDSKLHFFFFFGEVDQSDQHDIFRLACDCVSLEDAVFLR